MTLTFDGGGRMASWSGVCCLRMLMIVQHPNGTRTRNCYFLFFVVCAKCKYIHPYARQKNGSKSMFV
jgi:hypothetical protein